MKRLFLFPILVMILVSFVSCVKEPNDNPGSETSNSITIGKYDGMTVMTFDSIHWEYEWNNIIDTYQASFDINHDGSPDFYLETVATTSFEGSDDDPKDHFDVVIFSDYSDYFEFHNEIIKTIVYTEEDTTIVYTDSIPLIYIEVVHHCELATESEQPESYSNTVLFQHNKGDVLDNNDKFLGGSCDLIKFNRDYNLSYYSETEGAYIYESDITATWDCLNFPIGEEFYIGFKHTDKDKEHLGWIKLIIEPDSNGILLARPLETAYQE